MRSSMDWDCGASPFACATGRDSMEVTFEGCAAAAAPEEEVWREEAGVFLRVAITDGTPEIACAASWLAQVIFHRIIRFAVEMRRVKINLQIAPPRPDRRGKPIP